YRHFQRVTFSPASARPTLSLRSDPETSSGTTARNASNSSGASWTVPSRQNAFDDAGFEAAHGPSCTSTAVPGFVATPGTINFTELAATSVSREVTVTTAFSSRRKAPRPASGEPGSYSVSFGVSCRVGGADTTIENTGAVLSFGLPAATHVFVPGS